MRTPARLEVPGSKWVIDCPRELCLNAYRVYPGSPPQFLDADIDSTTGERRPVRRVIPKRGIRCDCTDDVACLHDIPCGQLASPVFPRNIAAGLAVLALRPPQHRGWLPGETVASLTAENIEHGIEAP